MKTYDIMKSDKSEETIQLCSFRLASRHYGVNIIDAKEISGKIDLTPVHHAPDGVSGYMNIRGQIHLVIDLRRLLGFEPSIIDEDTKVILFKSSVDEPFGILVDKIDDVVTVKRNQIEFTNNYKKIQANNENITKLNSNFNDIPEAVCKLENDLIVIVNPKNILKAVEKKLLVN